MATGGNTSSHSAVILERIESLRCDVAELAKEIKAYAEKYTTFQVEYEKRHAILDAKADASHARLNARVKEISELKDGLKTMKDAIAPLVMQSKIITWIAGVLGASVIALIWGVITHTVEIGIP